MRIHLEGIDWAEFSRLLRKPGATIQTAEDREAPAGAHLSECVSGSDPDGEVYAIAYVCPRCEKLTCACNGAADCIPDICDDCWSEIHDWRAA